MQEKASGAMRRAGEVSKEAVSPQPSAISRQPSAVRKAAAKLTEGLVAGGRLLSGAAARAALARIAEAGARATRAMFAGGSGRTTRQTAGAGSNLAPFFSDSPLFWPAGGGRTGASASRTPAIGSALPKPTAVNLRRFAETPVARRAINVIKDRIAGMRWRIQLRNGRSMEQIPDAAVRIRALTENFEAPNPDDSFRSLLEQVLEDVIVGGFGAIEIDRVEGWELGRVLSSQLSGLSGSGIPSHPNGAKSAPLGWGTLPNTLGPLMLWPVDGATIRILPDWDGRPDSPRYVQVTGVSGVKGTIVLNDDELS